VPPNSVLRMRSVRDGELPVVAGPPVPPPTSPIDEQPAMRRANSGGIARRRVAAFPGNRNRTRGPSNEEWEDRGRL